MPPQALFRRPLISLTAVVCSMLVSTMLSLHAKADISPLPDPAVEQHLAAIGKPERLFRLTQSAPAPGKPAVQKIKVFGSISDDDIRSLLQLSGYHRQSVYSIVGDAQYARVRAGMFCGSLCGSGTDLVFKHDRQGWTYLYSQEWIS
jgi:hypothetical protein